MGGWAGGAVSIKSKALRATLSASLPLFFHPLLQHSPISRLTSERHSFVLLHSSGCSEAADKDMEPVFPCLSGLRQQSRLHQVT